jgi:hypothetical protein
MSSPDKTLESLMEAPPIGLTARLLEDTRRAIDDAPHVEGGRTTLWAVTEEAGDKSVVRVGEYDASVLYRYAESAVVEFNRALREVSEHLDKMSALDNEDVEFEMQATLFWTKLRRLKRFFNASGFHNELIALLDAFARNYQAYAFSTQELRALSQAVRHLCKHVSITEHVMDAFCDEMEAAGFNIDSVFAAVDVRK